MTDYLQFLQYKTFELNIPGLQQQGYSDLIVEHEVGILDWNGSYLTKQIYDIQLIPNSRVMACLTEDSLLFIDAQRPHPLTSLTTSTSGSTLLSEALTTRTAGPDLRLMIDRHDYHPYTDIAGTTTPGLVLTTWYKKRQKAILRYRLLLKTETDSGTGTYVVSPDGSVTAGSSGGWIENKSAVYTSNPKPTVDGWNEVSWDVDLEDITSSYFWNAMFTLETELVGNVIQKDTVFAYSSYTKVKKEISLPSAITSPTSLSTTENGKLAVITSAGHIYEIDLHYDYFLVDYHRNKLWFMEDYDSVEVTS